MTITVVGIDGKIPIKDTGKWAIWSIKDIFLGAEGENKYIPKIDDFVVDIETFTWYKVIAIDPVSQIPTLREIQPFANSTQIDQNDVLLSPSIEHLKLYIDKSVTPYKCVIDARLLIYNSMSSYAKVFLGNDLGGQSKVISRVYDAVGNYIGENIQLETVQIDNHTNYVSKTVIPFNTFEDMLDGDMVTLVVYTDDGHVTLKQGLLVENTGFIRDVQYPTKYVTHIALDTPYLSATNDKVLEVPIHQTVKSINLIGRVYYSDGTVLELPVDGSKFSMEGLSQYVSTIIGQKMDLVLRYRLSDNEYAYGTTTTDNKYITEDYKLITTEPQNQYTVKLFVYPRWVNQVEGYRLEWYMLSLDRKAIYNVTDKVRFEQTTGSYNPKLYGYLQRKQVSIDLSTVSTYYKNFIHTQLVDIILENEPQYDTMSVWKVSHESIGDYYTYGDNVYTTLRKDASQQDYIDITLGLTDTAEWLDKLYFSTYPLMDDRTELTPPTPTHIRIFYNDVEIEERPVDDFIYEVYYTGILETFKNVTIIFLKATPLGYQYLSVAEMLVVPYI